MTSRVRAVRRLVFLAASWMSTVGPCAAASAPSRLPASGESPAGGRASYGFAPSPTTIRPTADSRLNAFDPSTRMLVELELRDASPEDRDYWLNLLSGVGPDQVPHLLEARRRAAAGRTAPRDPARNDRSTARPAPAPAATNSTGGGGHRRAAFQTEAAPAAPSQGLEAADQPPLQRTSHPGGTQTPVGAAEEAPATPRSGATSGVDARTSAVPEPAIVPPPEKPPESPAAVRRSWIPPLRHRWGEASRDGAADAEAAAPAGAAAAQTVPEVKSSAYMNVELQRVMTLLRAEIEHASDSGSSASPQEQVRRQVQLRLLHLLADEPQQALQVIPGLDAAEQEFWTQTLWAVHSGLKPAGGAARADHWGATADLLGAAEQRARSLAPLVIRHACFCHRINSFGSYETFGRDEFRPGQPVLVYAELRNFRSELTGAGGYRTRLRTVVEIVPTDANGAPLLSAPAIERREFPATEDLCRSERTDYFHSYRLDLPPDLTPGRYVLRIGIADELSRKTAEADLPFVIR